MKSLIFTLITTFLSTFQTAKASSSSYVPSNLDATKEIYVAYNAANQNLIQDYLTLLERKNPSLPTERQIKLNLVVGASLLQELKTLVAAHPALTPYISIYQSDMADDEIGSVTDWLQDSGEFFFDAKGKVSFLKHKQSPQFDLGGLLAKNRDVALKLVGGDQPVEDLSIEGGNIEGMPGGSVYVGEDIDNSIYTALQKIVGEKKVLKVPTNYSNVGHVDEAYQFLPTAKEKSAGCGYVLGYTDYLDGLRLALTFDLYGGVDESQDGPARVVAKKEYLDAIAYFTGVDSKHIQYTNTYFYQLIKKFNFSRMPRAFGNLYGSRKEDIYVYKAFVAQKEILKGVELLKAQSAKDGCPKLKTVSLPALWTFGFNSNPVFPESVEILMQERTSNLTAFTNLVVINDALVIPDTKVPSQLLVFHSEEEFEKIGTKFKEILTTRLKDVGTAPENIIFTNVAGSILGDGAAHCKSNVLRVREN